MGRQQHSTSGLEFNDVVSPVPDIPISPYGLDGTVWNDQILPSIGGTYPEGDVVRHPHKHYHLVR